MNDSADETTIEVCVSEIGELRGMLAIERHPDQASETHKLPFRLMMLAETSGHRVVDLCEFAIEGFQQSRPVCSLILIRSALETAISIYCVKEEMVKAIEKNNLDSLDHLSQTHLLADSWITGDDQIRPSSTPQGLFNKAKSLSGIDLRKNYDFLSQYVHPYLIGNLMAYSSAENSNIEKSWKWIGREHANLPDKCGLVELRMSISLMADAHKVILEELHQISLMAEKRFPNNCNGA